MGSNNKIRVNKRTAKKLNIPDDVIFRAAKRIESLSVAFANQRFNNISNVASEALNPNDVVFLNEPDTLKGENFIENVDINSLDYKHREHGGN